LMKKKAKRSTVSRLHIVCPFCGQLVDWITELTWCGNCYVEWYETRSGVFIFDDKRKTERFIWAKAICKSGGMRIGPVEEDD